MAFKAGIDDHGVWKVDKIKNGWESAVFVLDCILYYG